MAGVFLTSLMPHAHLSQQSELISSTNNLPLTTIIYFMAGVNSFVSYFSIVVLKHYVKGS